ncbi:family 20 glycosylhydrolase [Parabacteroides acidifaciens]|uniref:beta-N-acetylhexosaminidase n=1 Tax=Parabacteroides acidifaciens TaxID=2290935 RepID=A0A3D8HJI3_9BACT|nr:family 20 glycosylhydrolase [Parabacteroides acidifaciens]MBC8600176.1 family 20 glycosylhydrolase [Parabacteroides acidifaciens]RDU51126.1 beta-hexosaminidase [Parabacteroides acidifaciens]
MMKLISMCAGAALCILASCSEGPTKQMSYNQGINVIPTPVSLVQNEGSFKLNKNTAFSASTPEAKTVAEYFAAQMNLATGYQITVSDKAASNGIALTIDETLDVNDEGYTLDVTPNGVTVKAKNPQGLFYGMQTFMQLLPAEIESQAVVNGIAWTAPCVTVKDEPRFGYRGIMLDPCRHFIPVENVKKHLDVLALFKINRMHWHLTDDQGWRIEIKKYPKLTEIGSKRIDGEGTEYGGFYTQDQIKEIVKYAADRFITIVPEIELPGHELAAIAAYPELSCKGEPTTPRIIWGVEDIVMCAGKEEPFEFMQGVFDEVAPLFPGEYIHIGGDECPKISWKNCPLCQKRIREEGLKADKEHSAEEKLQSYFVQRMEKYLAEKHGKKIIGWDEILEGGLAPTATVMSWRGEEGGIAAANLGHEAIMTPSSNGMYIDQFQGDPKIEPVSIGGYDPLERVYAYNPTPDTLVAAGKDHFIKGVQSNLWSEYMYNTDLLEYRAYPRVLAVAEIGWTPLARKDYKDFERRLDNALVRLDALNINYHIPQPEQPNGSCNFVAFTDKASLEFKTSRPIKVVYTIDGTEPTPESTVYTAPIEFTESGVLKIRSVLPSGKMSKTRTITVEKQALAPAKEVAKTTPGLEMQVTDGMYLNTSKLVDAKEWKKSVIKDLREITSVVKTSESMRGVKQYAAIATGYVNIPEDGVYYISSDNEEVWIDGKLLVNNGGEVKRFSRHDSSAALSKGLHEIKVVFLGHIIGGWPSNWNDGSVKLRKADTDKFVKITPEMLVH